VITDHHCGIVVLEQLLAGEEVKSTRGERVLVGPTVERLPHQLFGCGVGHRADSHIGGGQTRGVFDHARDPEVRE
jgi:hypothetical protein